MTDTDFGMMDCAGCYISNPINSEEKEVTTNQVTLEEVSTDKDNEILLYTTGCPQCIILEKKLDMNKIAYKKVSDFDVEELISKGINSAPVLKVGETYLPFNLALKWVNQQR